MINNGAVRCGKPLYLTALSSNHEFNAIIVGWTILKQNLTYLLRAPHGVPRALCGYLIPAFSAASKSIRLRAFVTISNVRESLFVNSFISRGSAGFANVPIWPNVSMSAGLL